MSPSLVNFKGEVAVRYGVHVETGEGLVVLEAFEPNGPTVMVALEVSSLPTFRLLLAEAERRANLEAASRRGRRRS